MDLSMYVVYNVLTGAYSGIYLFRNDAIASVELALVQSQKCPLDECELYRIGSFNDVSGEIVPASKIKLEFDTRRLNMDKAV